MQSRASGLGVQARPVVGRLAWCEGGVSSAACKNVGVVVGMLVGGIAPGIFFVWGIMMTIDYVVVRICSGPEPVSHAVFALHSW